MQTFQPHKIFMRVIHHNTMIIGLQYCEVALLASRCSCKVYEIFQTTPTFVKSLSF